MDVFIFQEQYISADYLIIARIKRASATDDSPVRLAHPGKSAFVSTSLTGQHFPHYTDVFKKAACDDTKIKIVKYMFNKITNIYRQD